MPDMRAGTAEVIEQDSCFLFLFFSFLSFFFLHILHMYDSVHVVVIFISPP